MRPFVTITQCFFAAGLVSAGPQRRAPPPEGVCRLFCCYPATGDYQCVADCTRFCIPESVKRGWKCPLLDWDGTPRCHEQVAALSTVNDAADELDSEKQAFPESALDREDNFHLSLRSEDPSTTRSTTTTTATLGTPSPLPTPTGTPKQEKQI